MNAELGMIFAVLIFGMGLLIGVAIGFQLSESQNDVGDLVIAPGDEDAPNYIFLDLDTTPDDIRGRDHVLLNVRSISAREKHSA